jgi:putative peptidoglycan lipid II flippase
MWRGTGLGRQPGVAGPPGAAKTFLAESAPLVGLAISGRLYLGIERVLAAGLPAGTISALAFANRFATVPVAVLSSVGTPLFTLLVGHAVRGNLKELSSAGERGIRLSFFIVAPAILFVILFAEPIVSVMLQRGSFGAGDVRLTAAAVQAFAWGIFGWVGSDLASRMLWAQSRYWASLRLATGFMIVNALAAIVLRQVSGGVGLAAARSLAFTFYLVFALIVVQRHSPAFRAWRVGAALGRQVVVALGAGLLVAGLLERLSLLHGSLGQRFAVLFLAGSTMVCLYLVGEGLLWRSEEGIWVFRFARDRAGRAAIALGLRR